MCNYEDLKHKRRTIQDLIRLINNKNTEGDTPNFSLFLGSGASKTSGIRTGEELIREWKMNIFLDTHHENENIDEDKLKEKVDKYFNEEPPAWYETSNQYSSLFEHQYDLQRQRRAFVEKEVDNKKPSIGYAYLVKLVDANYFNTIFTTNFDDLLNESFYRFSKRRPIVCAQDSSITSVTVTSKRTKIIKLHGDYLFENIKATSRETESLEQNMKMKFMEFAKDFGLIIVGYAGEDESIMDILFTLLQREDYFKNGIYWCIRKGSMINGKLKKLLWRDRVFFIEIDGFDELMAAFNDKLNKGALPVDDSFLGIAHQKEVINELTENEYIKLSESPILKRDCNQLSECFDKNYIKDFIDYTESRRSKNDINERKIDNLIHAKKKYPKLTSLTKNEKEEISDIMMQRYFGNEAIIKEKIEKMEIKNLPNGIYKLKLLEILADLSEDWRDVKIKECFDELIQMSPLEKYYLIAANRSSDLKQKDYYFNLAVSKYENDCFALISYARFLYEHRNDVPKQNAWEEKLNKAIDLLDKSLQIDDNINSDVRLLLCKCYSAYYSNDSHKRNELNKKICDDLFNRAKFNPTTLSILDYCKDERYNKDLLINAKSFYLKADNDDAQELVYRALIDYYDAAGEFSNVKSTMKEFENYYIPSENYLMHKASILLDHEKFHEVENCIKKIDSSNTIKIRMTLANKFHNDDELDRIYKSSNKTTDIVDLYYSLKGDYSSLCEVYKQRQNDNSFDYKDLISYSFALLKENKYNDVTNLLKPYYESPIFKTGEIIINYLFAKYHNDSTKLEEKIKEKIFINNDTKDSIYDDTVLAAAYSLLNDMGQSINYINKVVQKSPSFIHDIQGWPVMNLVLNSDKYNNLKRKIEEDCSTIS